jgi:hypothetical protein
MRSIFCSGAVSTVKGKLVLAFANVAAFERFDFDDPDRSRYIDEDYNRVWADDVILGKRDSAELRRARELRPFVDAATYLPTSTRCTSPAGRSWCAACSTRARSSRAGWACRRTC